MSLFRAKLAATLRGNDMLPIDGFYLYRLGWRIHPLGQMEWSAATYQRYAQDIFAAQSALDQLINNSVIRLVSSREKADHLLSLLSALIEKMEHHYAQHQSLDDGEFDLGEVNMLREEVKAFEHNFEAELRLGSLHIVRPEGGYEALQLLHSGEVCFPLAMGRKVPEAVHDAREAGRCLAFAVPTAAGLLMHRAHEAVLKRYFDAVAGRDLRPRNPNIGAYLRVLEEKQLGDEIVREALKALNKLHRNPLIHPQHTLESVEEALNLLGAIRASVGYMLPHIPEPDSDDGGFEIISAN